MILCVKQSLNLVLMIFGGSLSIELRVVIEEVRVDLVQEPGALKKDRLHEHKEGRCDPIYEGACWPGVSEGQMKELKHLEEGSEPVHKPMLIVFSDSSLK